jgi:PilZ domain
MAPLRLGQDVGLRFELLSPRLCIEITGRVAWADRTGQAGVEFLDISPKSRRLLKEWIFAQFLAMAHHVAWESVFVPATARDARELSFSPKARPPIRLNPETQDLAPVGKLKETTAPDSPSLPALKSPWIRPWLSDGLILISAVLLFFVISLAMTHFALAWPVGLALALGVAGVFVAVYAFLFAFWVGMTPGEHLARLARGSSIGGLNPEEEERPRFR